MPRPKRPGAPEPKRRSRTGCWPCKARKVKCGEEKPVCLNCQRQGDKCDYSIRLNWEGRGRKRSSVHETVFTANQKSAAETPTTTTKPTPAPPATTEPQLPATPLPVAERPAPISFINQAPESPSRLEKAMENALHTAAATYAEPPLHLSHPSSTNLPCSPVTQPSPRTLPALDVAFGSTNYPFFSTSTNAEHQPSPTVPSPRLFTGNAYTPQTLPYLRSASAQGPFRLSPAPAAERDASVSPHVSLKRRKCSALFEAATTKSEEAARTMSQAEQSPQHRMSVNSLISQSLSAVSPKSVDHSSQYYISEADWARDEYVNYGYDHGHPDDDLNSRKCDGSTMMFGSVAGDGAGGSVAERESTPDSDKDTNSRPVTAFSKGGYYASPVPVNIPIFLTPLPSSLTQSPINLLYFHHFLNHTAKILAPHACLCNPFMTVLPKMAITDQNLLNLLLAYSASHRARLIGHPEPAHRIAHWVRYVFPSLRHALSDPQQRSSHIAFATAIMLVSLKIISPSTFEVPITWQDHLKLARELYKFYRKAHVGRQTTQVGEFLSNWFGYIDILGSISCEDIAPPMPGVYYPPDMTMSPLHEGADWEVECYSGFTPRTGALMFRLADLIYQAKISREASPLSGQYPSQRVLAQAEQLLEDIKSDRANLHKRRTHHEDADASVIFSIDDSYQLACLLHLYRRVFGKSQLDSAVRSTVNELMRTLENVGRGGSAEACVLFPIFTVGCETTDLMHRQTVIDRVFSFEHLGLKQVREARKLMQRAWEKNLPWTDLTNGEFLG